MNDAWVVNLALVSLVALACGVLAYAWTRRRLGAVSFGVFVVALVSWVLDVAAISSGFRDADGFVDCGDACTVTHRLAALGFVGLPLLLAISAAGMLIAVVVRARRRRVPA